MLFVQAFAAGGFITRIPDIQLALGLSETQLGLALGRTLAVLQAPDCPAEEIVAVFIVAIDIAVLVAPTDLGWLAEVVGFRVAFAAMAPPFVLSVVLAGHIRWAEPEP